MPRLTKIYTRTGDDGTTGLGTGRRVPKTHRRIEAFGTIDELNSILGVALTLQVAAELRAPLRRVQNDLFHAGSDLCVPEEDKSGMPVPRIEPRHVAALEALIDTLNESLPALENFILPGGDAAAAQLHVARSVCRRAERDVLRLRESEAVSADLVTYLNRLSDALFVMARFQNKTSQTPDTTWDSRA